MAGVLDAVVVKGGPIRSFTDRRLDFNPAPLRKSYIVASSYRCGSTLLCTELWRTGLLGAPWEYLNNEFGVMMERLEARSPEEYLSQLLHCRTSRNGVFGMKAHFHHFEAGLARLPDMLERLAPVSFIYISRRDTLAQAISMAKAYQTKAWTSLASPDRSALRYDREHIARCAQDIERQRLGWLRWFETNKVTPFVVTYEDLTADPGTIVDGVIELLDVRGDLPEDVRLPIVERQRDRTNDDWIERFRAGE
jgi:trehalose 2-sulfotransferase